MCRIDGKTLDGSVAPAKLSADSPDLNEWFDNMNGWGVLQLSNAGHSVVTEEDPENMF